MFSGFALLLSLVALIIPVTLWLVTCLPIAWFSWSCLRRIPREYRTQDPIQCWLLAIPLLNLVWNFFVFPKISESYQKYFAAKGRYDIGDANASLAWAYCIVAAASVFMSCLAVFAALVLAYIYLNRMLKLRDQVDALKSAGR